MSQRSLIVILMGCIAASVGACSKSAQTPAQAPPAAQPAPSAAGSAGSGNGPAVSGHEGSSPVDSAGSAQAPAADPQGGGAAPGAAEPPNLQTPTEAPAGTGGSEGAAFTWTAPASWEQQSPSSPMRRAQFRVPGKGAHQDAECVVFYFGPGQGGSAQSNAARWVDQFQQPDGSSSQEHSKVDVRTVNGLQVMFVEVKGTYMPMAMPGAAAAGPKPGYAMMGAIVSASDAPWFFKMTGPAATVEANKDAFKEWIASLKPAA